MKGMIEMGEKEKSNNNTTQAICPRCRTEVCSTDIYCGFCGKKLQANPETPSPLEPEKELLINNSKLPQVTCPACGKKFPLGIKFCNKCHTLLPKEAAENEKVPEPDESKKSPREIFEHRQSKLMLGKKVREDIVMEWGTVIFRKGDIVTEKVIALAKEKGLFAELSATLE